MHVPAAVISLAVAPKDPLDGGELLEGAQPLHEGRPHLPRSPGRRVPAQTIISGMGELHLEIYMERMKREYNCEVIAGKPQVAYRETITKRAEFAYTHKKQTGGSGQFARVCGYIEPLPSDAVEPTSSSTTIVGGSIPREFISACDKGFKEAIKKGTMIGFPIVGLRCVINDGASHAVDSSEQAFKTAALMGFREAYDQGQADVLEPIMKVEIEAPTEFQGSVVGQVNQRRGVILETTSPATTSPSRRGAAQHHVRLLDGPSLGDAGQGQLHDGVRPVRHRPQAGAGGDGQEVPRQARRRSREEVRGALARRAR
jgi:elongation factor G